MIYRNVCPFELEWRGRLHKLGAQRLLVAHVLWVGRRWWEKAVMAVSGLGTEWGHGSWAASSEWSGWETSAVISFGGGEDLLMVSFVGQIPPRCFLRFLPSLHLQLGTWCDCWELALLLWLPAWDHRGGTGQGGRLTAAGLLLMGSCWPRGCAFPSWKGSWPGGSYTIGDSGDWWPGWIF